MTTPDKHRDAESTPTRAFAPTPHQLGLTINPDLSWEDIGIAEPTPSDLFGCRPGLTWESFGAIAQREAVVRDAAAEMEAGE